MPPAHSAPTLMQPPTNNLDAGDAELLAQAAKMAEHFGTLANQMLNLSGQEANPQDVADIIYRCAT